MEWGKLYPVLDKYEDIIDSKLYSEKVSYLINELIEKYHFNNEQAFLVLKDISYKLFLKNKELNKKL